MDHAAIQPIMEFIDLKSQYQALKADIDARIQRVLDHGQYIMGPEVRELEDALAAYTGAQHCITCASGTEALLMSMMALGIGRGDEVVTTPFTFAATAEMIVLLGARPVFVDIEPDTCLMDASKVEAAITQQTKAIMPVSLYGQVCDMEAINAIAQRHGGIPVIEDGAQSFGATYRASNGIERKSCHLSTLGCTSFFPSKPLGCYGDGGAIFTDDDELRWRCAPDPCARPGEALPACTPRRRRADGHAAMCGRARQAAALRVGDRTQAGTRRRILAETR